MSVLKTSQIQSPDSDTPQILLSASGLSFSASALELKGGDLDLPDGTTIDGDTIAVASDLTSKLDIVAQQTNRNVLYNGAMQVAQRGVSASGITSSGYRTADRWRLGLSSFGTWTETVENDGPTQVGLRKSLKLLCTSANASPAGSNQIFLNHRLEGQDVQRFAKGTASAKTMTASFWVKSNVTGNYILSLFDSNNSRHVSQPYTINTSETWEKKTLTFPADTSGLFNNNNGRSLDLFFYLGSGSDFTTGTLATTWEADTPSNRAVGQVNVGANVNNYWQITGVQLEAGSVATDFEFRSIGQELANCQRYFWRVGIENNGVPIDRRYNYASASASVIIPVIHPVIMRANPTITATGDITDAASKPFDNIISFSTRQGWLEMFQVPSLNFVDVNSIVSGAEL